ncbi:MAG: arsenosugar biosynthesis radical SAM protein ArsS [Polyangiales bacterium]
MLHLPLAHAAVDGSRFAARVRDRSGGPLRAVAVDTLQVNVGKRCNQACRHCHVDAGPARTEEMSRATAEKVIAALGRHQIPTLDITGGAPELNASFRWMVSEARALGARVMVRHNLTVQFEPGQEDLVAFFDAHDVEVVSSLPHYTQNATDRQRGGGVFDKSIAALRALNAVGYGTGRPDRPLNLVYNPVGAFLPGSQEDLERDYKRELSERHGVTFDGLFTITNMPIARFRDWLAKTGQLDEYQAKLEAQFNPSTVPALMCRTLVSVSWDGLLYDCDFNQMCGLPVKGGALTLDDFDAVALARREVATADHCFGCTAGAGSSCGGALAE